MDSRCPICHCKKTQNFLYRTSVPVHQNGLFENQEAAQAIGRGNLNLLACQECGFVFNQDFDSSKLEYGQSYDNTQDWSSSFQEHLHTLIDHLIHKKGVRKSQIVEVGCGKGKFLQALVSHPEGDNQGYGFDPSYVGPEVLENGKLRFERRFYDRSCTHIPADVVICRHVIEHISDPVGFLKTIREALRDSKQARVFFETPCLEWILRHRVIWDFFYEHCSYFTLSSLKTAFECAGFQVESVSHVFSGQYLWLEASLKNDFHHQDSGQSLQMIQDYLESENSLINAWHTKIETLLKQGKVALWGAGAKGVTFANMMDPLLQKIDCVVDLNPKKQYKFIPGTGHPIIPYQDLIKRSIKNVVVMNPNYLEENQKLLKDAGLNIGFL